MIKGQQEVQEVKTQLEGKLEKSSQKVLTLERSNATILQEKKTIDGQMAMINQQLDIVSQKMDERNTQIK
jgi:predicted AAA+ superfamily ATPase